METEQLASEGIYHPGNALAQKVLLVAYLHHVQSIRSIS